MDSSAFDHMCHDISSFDSYTQITHTFITIPNSSKVFVTHVGTIKLTDSITLKNVLNVPSFKFNLISVNNLCHNGVFSLQFTPDMCFIFIKEFVLVYSRYVFYTRFIKDFVNNSWKIKKWIIHCWYKSVCPGEISFTLYFSLSCGKFYL